MARAEVRQRQKAFTGSPQAVLIIDACSGKRRVLGARVGGGEELKVRCERARRRDR